LRYRKSIVKRNGLSILSKINMIIANVSMGHGHVLSILSKINTNWRQVMNRSRSILSILSKINCYRDQWSEDLVIPPLSILSKINRRGQCRWCRQRPYFQFYPRSTLLLLF